MGEKFQIPMGWMCPLCRRVWSPDVHVCTCRLTEPQPEPDDDDPTLVPQVGYFPRWVETRTG